MRSRVRRIRHGQQSAGFPVSPASILWELMVENLVRTSGRVSRFADSSGNGRHFDEDGVFALSEATVRGYSTPVFDGTSGATKRFLCPTDATLDAVTSHTLACVLSCDLDADWYDTVFCRADAYPPNGTYLSTYWNAGNSTLLGVGSSAVVMPTRVFDVIWVVTAEYDGISANTVKTYVDGVLVHSDSFAAYNFQNSASMQLGGCDWPNPGGADGFKGSILDKRGYGRVWTAQEAADYAAWAKTKFGSSGWATPL